MRPVDTCQCCLESSATSNTKYGNLCTACKEATEKAERLPRKTIESARPIESSCDCCVEEIAEWKLANGMVICKCCMDAMMLVLKEGK